MTGTLPKGWANSHLIDLVRIRDSERIPVNQKERESRPGSVPYYGATGQVGTIDDALFDEDLLLLGEDGVQFFDPFKPKAYLISGPAWVNNHAHVLEPLHVDRRYLKYFLDQADYHGLATGTTRLKLTQAAMKRLVVPVPPATEQSRIVEELERRLSHVDAAEQGLREAIRVADLARLSVLRAGTRGADIGLVVDDPASGCVDAGVPFERDSEHNHIVWVRLGDIAKVGSGTTPTRGDPRYWEDGDVPWVTSGQVSAGVITNPSALVTQAAFKETSLKLWPAGTLLMAMYGEGQTRGRCAELRLDATCNQACAAIQLRPEFENYRQFVLLFLQSRYDEHRQLGGGGVQENLNLGLVRDIRIPLAGESTQRELVIEMDRKLSLINSAQLAAESSLVRTAALRRSILAAAFSGELVPQNPNDEPADVLLERIRAGRAAAQSKKKTRTKRKEAVS